jgi:hypothetical protein
LSLNVARTEIPPHVENASNERTIDAALERFVQQRVNAVFVAADAYFTTDAIDEEFGLR